MGILLAEEVIEDVIHLLADGRIVGQHLTTKASGREVRQFFPDAFEKGFRIGKLLRIVAHKSDPANQPFVLQGVLGIKQARLIWAGRTYMKLFFTCGIWEVMHLAKLSKCHVAFIEKAKLIP